MLNITHILQLLLRRYETLYFILKINTILKFYYCILGSVIRIFFFNFVFGFITELCLRIHFYVKLQDPSDVFVLFLVNLEIYKMVIPDLLIRVY